MKQDLFSRITKYTATMTAVKLMLKTELITLEEYLKIETDIANKYGLSSSVIYRLKPLIYKEERGNM